MIPPVSVSQVILKSPNREAEYSWKFTRGTLNTLQQARGRVILTDDPKLMTTAITWRPDVCIGLLKDPKTNPGAFSARLRVNEMFLAQETVHPYATLGGYNYLIYGCSPHGFISTLFFAAGYSAFTSKY